MGQHGVLVQQRFSRPEGFAHDVTVSTIALDMV